MLKIYQLRLPQNTFEVTLKYRGVGVRVSFTDGNNYRDIPAKCYTNDPFKQRAIEASKMFKDKDIVLERTVAEETKEPAKGTDGTVNEPTTTPALTGDDTEKKVFDSLPDAIQFIATTYQTQVQTANEARNFLKEKGIKATIKQG